MKNKSFFYFFGFLSGILFCGFLIFLTVQKSKKVLGKQEQATLIIPSPSPSSNPHISPSPSSFPKPSPKPSPSSSPLPKTYPTSLELDELFAKYGAEYGVDLNVLRQLASCESGFHVYAVNGSYAGLFQFDPRTWIVTRQQMGLDTDTELRFNWEEAIRTVAFKISRDGLAAWPSCKFKL